MHYSRATLVFVIVAGIFAPGRAWAQGSKSEPAEQLVLVGLWPKTEGGTGDLKRLAEAQQIRAVAQTALAQASRRQVIGHDALKKALGQKYLVDWFSCGEKLNCIIKVLAPLRNSGYEVAVTGDYTTTADTYRFHLVSFTIDDAKIVREVTFELPAAEAKDPAKWRESLAGLNVTRGGKVTIVINVGDTTCKVDGQPCTYDADGKTLSLAPGQHEIELSKDQYQPEKIVVTVKAGSEEEVAVALKPVDKTQTVTGTGQTVTAVGAGRQTPTLTAIRTDNPPVIDGKLDDASWQKAWLESNFTQKLPEEGKAPNFRTELRILYDDSAVYVAIRCFDPQPQLIQRRLTRRDRDIDADKVVVEISSKNDKASSYSFQVNAAGVQVDGVRFGDTNFGTEWDGRWYSEVTRDAQGWKAEMQIPLQTLRYTGDVTSFGFQVRRFIGRTGELYEWAYIPSSAQGEVSAYGTLDGITGLKAKRLINVLAYDSRRLVYRRKQGVLDGTRTGGNIGADLKFGLTPALTLDATINPDFGTVEVDQAVLNLTNVEQYFPEKRPFFIEGADIFATPFQLFYSRRIGLAPPAPTVGSIVEPTPDGRIWSALKLTGLIGKRLSIGLINAVTAEQNVLIERNPGDAPEEVLVEPLSNFSVLRLRQEFGLNSSIGLLATSLNRFEEKNAATPMPGDLCPFPITSPFATLTPPANGRCTNDAYTGGVDTVIRSDDGMWGASAQVVGSLIKGGPTRLIPDGTTIGDGDMGVGVISKFGKYAGATLWEVGYSNATPRLQINDSGYLDFANFQQASASVTFRATKPSGAFLRKALTFGISHKRDWKLRDNISTEPLVKLVLQLKNYWQIAVLGEVFPPFVENRETGDGARVERNFGTYGVARIVTDSRKSAVFALQTTYFHTIGDKISTETQLTASFRPIPTLELDLIPKLVTSYNGNRYYDTITNMDGTRTYVFAELNAASLDVTLRGTYTFTRKLTLQAYLQPFIVGGHRQHPNAQTVSGAQPRLPREDFNPFAYPIGDFRRGSINANVFVRWEYLPLSTFWLVYTRSQGQTPYDPLEGEGRLRLYPFIGGASTDVILAKLSYLWY